ncbi:CFI-box-CTERM domain-containing protein [Geomonas sp. Red32]|uniref:CFI-box-CTERM domain-containing protein n=1 Tax=Geomonas sp. Red32 TaxID=2912856 RepID=UPI00202CF001|nr:CFI-box-CTERM domain-containing protein [Geomonas sp. Red32]
MVSPGVAATTQTLTVGATGDYPTIQTAIQHAISAYAADNSLSFIISVQPGTYTGTVTLNNTNLNGISIVGAGTANTFINGSGTVFNISGGMKNVSIRKFTFTGGSVAISLNGSQATNIQNCIFKQVGTAIQNTGSSSTAVVNNTFYNNSIGIATNSDLTIINDLFDLNSRAIDSQVSITQPTYNAFYGNGSNGITVTTSDHNLPNTDHPQLDPLFANPPDNLHLQSGSPCRGTGNVAQYPNSFDPTTSDIGAYGGLFSDIVTYGPPVVTGLASSITSKTAPGTVSLGWNASTDSQVTGYRVYYRDSAGAGIQAAEGASGAVVLTTNNASLTFNTYPPAPSAPANPPVVTITPGDRVLNLSWPAVPGATDYQIYYSTTSFDSTSLPAATLPLTTATSYQITGLTNGTRYYVAVQPRAQAALYFRVTAVIDRTVASNPGSANESDLSAEIRQIVGDPVLGAVSSVAREFPEQSSPFPDVKSQGCFIATAAYGFYSAPQVQALRQFRDRYLMTNATGRAFVAWYYKHGPKGAAYLRAHPWLKGPVRAILFPFVILALFMVYIPPLMKIAMIMTAGVVADHAYREERRKRIARRTTA